MCALTFTQIVATLLATNTVEREGRKKVILSGQARIIVILLSIFVVDKFFSFLGSGQKLLIMVLIFAHIVTHNKSLGAMGIVYCADILNDLSWMTVSIKVCSFTVALTSEYMI